MDNYNYTPRHHSSEPIPNYQEQMKAHYPPSFNYHYQNRLQYQQVNDSPHHNNYSSSQLRGEYSHPHEYESNTNRPMVIEPPTWASPAKGESSLEPIGDTALTHPPVDLTTRKFFLVGRSPSSHLPLLHSTSSRRHALLFHHPNGSCYLTDCNSAHGTFVDGVRVKPHPHPPKRVRRGALVRFGGPGAPSFVLKSFSVKLKEMVKDLGGVAEAYFPKPNPIKSTPPIICESSSSEEDEIPPVSSTQADEKKHVIQPVVQNKETKPPARKSNGVLACIRGDGGGVACIADGEDAPEAALVLLNTRINAVGKGAMKSECDRKMARSAQAKFENMGIKRKRESTDEEPSYCTEYKRPKKSILKKIKSFEHESNPCVTPRAVLVPENMFTPCEYFRNTRRTRRVIFSDEEVDNYFGPNVTPDEVSTHVDDPRVRALKNVLPLPIL